VIRALLVPSLMVLLGNWNWWAPGRCADYTRARHLSRTSRRSESQSELGDAHERR
jgi:uncharacterized membrane protein YdfJ with MMPL/SSD domain